MKLAEALKIRSDLQERIGYMSERLDQNATVQEGEKPGEDPIQLMKELDEMSDELEEIIARINHTNAKTICDGISLTQMIAKRDVLMKKIKIYREFKNSANGIADRVYGSDIKVLSTVDVSKLQRKIDEMSKAYRELEIKIQETNWTVELM